jgi:hypothetical protein
MRRHHRGAQLAVRHQPDRKDHRRHVVQHPHHARCGVGDVDHHRADAQALLHQRPVGHGVLGVAAEVGHLQRQPVLAQVGQVTARAVAAHEGMPGRLRGRARVAVLLHPAGRRVEARLRIADETADQVGLVGPQMAHGDVGLAPAQVAQCVRRHHVDHDAGRLLAQLSHQAGQQMGGHRLAGRDGDHAIHCLRLAGGGQRQVLGRRTHHAGMLQQRQPGGRGHHGLAGPLEQRDAQLPFDGRHLPAERGLGQAQLARRSRQRPGLGRLEKCLQLVPVGLIHTPSHECSAILGDVHRHAHG